MDSDNVSVLEKRLWEAVYVGDTDSVQDLLVNVGVNANACHPPNAWTSLHLACKKGYLDIVALLLKFGADKNARSMAGETPASLCSNQQILYLLSMSDGGETARIVNDSLHTVPCNPIFTRSELLAMNSSKIRLNTYDAESKLTATFQDELVLKIRVANDTDPDFIEVELPRSELTYQALMSVCCKELDLSPQQVLKLRKLPDTRLRRDKDVQRLQNLQEIEVVTDTTSIYRSLQNVNGVISNCTPTVVPANGYQSISKKDQTILY